MIVDTFGSRKTGAASQRPKKGHEPWFLAPGSARRIRNRALVQRLGFHREIDLGVDVGGVDGDMAEPSADRVDVDARPQQMDGGRMPAMSLET
jgi:hypothetical protein